ncbi:MAG: hypothetical protein K0R51_3015 [Cytophagaceae bacterium]|jgi:hypothetical protein|nr:hypothetical protein [Cytophagaceae bacterium]
MTKFFIFAALFLCSPMHAQTVMPENTVLSEESPEESQVYQAEELVQIQPTINLNKVNAVDLSATGLLNKKQVQDILQHRAVFGKFMSVYELQSIPSLSLDTLRLLSTVLYVPQKLGNHHSLPTILEEGSHYSLLRWHRKTEQSRGYRTDSKGNRPYAGSDYNLLYRFRSSFSQVYQLGLTLEKDAGERLQWSPPTKHYGFDYLSAYLLVHPKRIIEQIAIGDFHFRSGHGLIFGGNFFFSKNPEYWQGSWQLGTGFRPHSSSSEYGFFRGAGIKLQRQNIEVSWFYSYTAQDGTLQENGTISALNTGGLHRTSSEYNKRYNTHLQQTGGSLCYTTSANRWKAGIEYLNTQFEHPLVSSDVYYHNNTFRGKEHHIGGGYLQYQYASGMLFAEAALSSAQGRALYGGLIHTVSRQNTWIMQCWSSNVSFRSFQGNIPSYSNSLSNETGIYQALIISLTPKIRSSLGFSIFTNPSPAFNKKGPTYGSEWIGRLTYQLKKKTIAFLQFRWRSNEENFKTDSSLYSRLLPLTRYYLMADLYHKENLIWGFHSRAQWSTFSFPVKEKGYCISQSINYRCPPFQFTTQVSVFETDSWDSRLYAYEPDLPLAFSIPPLSGKGVRFCLIATVKVFKKNELSGKIAHVKYSGQKTIGSGYDEVEGNEQWEVKVQMRVFL